MSKIKDLFRSRKFWVAVATVAADVTVSCVPALADVQEELVKVITAVGIVLIAAIAGEDMSYWFGAAKKK